VSREEAEPRVTELGEHAARLANDLPGDLRRLRLKADGEATELEVEWHGPPAQGAAHAAAPPPVVVQPTLTHPAVAAADPATVPAAEAQQPPADVGPEPEPSTEDDRTMVEAPMVGTFYRAPEPGADPFVEVGDEVEPDTVIGIVEAMKLMNPVTAEARGRIVEILAANAEPVEYGQPLVALSTSDIAAGA
jgi:acetyl-CoA carboxylase biotin carboxyl carrier protein